MSVSELRQRVADEVAAALLGNGIGHDPHDAAHVADVALAAFAEWLRKRGDGHWRQARRLRDPAQREIAEDYGAALHLAASAAERKGER